MPSLNRDTVPDTTSVTLPAREAPVIAGKRTSSLSVAAPRGSALPSAPRTHGPT